MNWKRKVDDREEAQRLAKQKELEEEEKRRLVEKEQRVKQMIESLKRFRCHICNKSASQPKWIGGTTMSGDPSFGSGGYEDWTEPGDLWQCKNCNQWTCAEHLHKGVCQRCAEKL